MEEIVACEDNEKVVDISMPTTMFESSEDEITKSFVVEVIKKVIDVPGSVTTLDNNKCTVIDVEKNEVSANFNKENMEDELNLDFTNDNKSYFVFVNVQDHDIHSMKILMYYFHKF